MSESGAANEISPIPVNIDYFSPDDRTKAVQDHTLGHARSFWLKFGLGSVVDEAVFVRGVLATIHKKRIERALRDGEKDNPDALDSIQLHLGVEDEHENFHSHHEYSLIETQCLRQSSKIAWNSYGRHAEDKYGWLTSKYFKLWWSLRQLSTPHALLLMMSVFAAITQGMDQQSMAGANIHGPEAWGISLAGVFVDPTPVLNENQIHLTKDLWRFGAINGAPFLLGGIAGVVLLDPISETWQSGRRGAILIAGFFSLASVVASAAVHKWGEMLICRLALGFGMAGKASIVPILLSETSAKHMRGFLVLFWQLFVAGGIAISALVNIGVYHLNDKQSWRWMFIAAGFPALILVILTFFCQESPRWLLKRGDKRVVDAFDALAALHGLHSPIVACGELYLLHTRLQSEQNLFETGSLQVNDAHGDETATELNDIESGQGHTTGLGSDGQSLHRRTTTDGSQDDQMPLYDFNGRTGGSSIVSRVPGHAIADNTPKDIPSIKEIPTRKRWSLMKMPRMRRANYAAAAVMISQQLCGINFLAFLGDTFIRHSLFRNTDSGEEVYTILGCSVGYGLIQFFSTLLASPFIDEPYKGRRFLLNISFPLMACSQLIAGLVLLAPLDEDNNAKTPVIVVHLLCLFVFTIAYSIGEGPAAFVISSEIFQTVNRELGMSCAVCLNFTGAGLLALLAVPLTKYMGQPYILVGCFVTNIFAWICCFLLVPDTDNLELEEIALRLNIPTRVSVIYHLAWLWNRLCTFGREHDAELNALGTWYEKRAGSCPEEVRWSMVLNRQ